MRTGKKVIILILMLTFSWAVFLSAMPAGVHSVSNTDKIPGSVESPPGAFEKSGQTEEVVKEKNSPLSIIILGSIIAGAVLAYLILFVFKSYDIRGDWRVTERWVYLNIDETNEYELHCNGEKEKGEAVSDLASGEYTCNKKRIMISMNKGENKVISGSFKGQDTIEGAVTQNGISATWNAKRIKK